MTKQEIKNRLSELSGDQAFETALAQADSFEASLAVFAQYGIEASEEELKAIFAPAGNADGELSLDDLDNVAGGSWLGDFLNRINPFTRYLDRLERITAGSYYDKIKR